MGKRRRGGGGRHDEPLAPFTIQNSSRMAPSWLMNRACSVFCTLSTSMIMEPHSNKPRLLSPAPTPSKARCTGWSKLFLRWILPEEPMTAATKPRPGLGATSVRQNQHRMQSHSGSVLSRMQSKAGAPPSLLHSPSPTQSRLFGHRALEGSSVAEIEVRQNHSH